MRERVGIIDLTSFGKLEVAGADALALLERVCGNRIDRPVGSVVYTQLLDERGGIVGDVTVTRLADDRFRIVTGAGAVDSDRGFLELHAAGDVAIDDVTDELAVIGIWGPAAREALAAVTDDDVSSEAFPFRTAKTVEVGGVPVLAQRITYVGELGYELYIGASRRGAGLGRADARGVAGARRLHGARLAPDREGLPLLRRRPDELRHAVRGGPRLLRRAGQASGARPLSARQRLRTLVVGGEDYLTVYGGEAVHAGRRRWSGASAARPTASPCGGTSRSPSCRRSSRKARRCRSTCWASSCLRVVAPDALYDPGQRACAELNVSE